MNAYTQPTITTATSPIESSEDMIDSRFVIARLEELEALETDGEVQENGQVWILDTDQREELMNLRRLAEQGEDASTDWQYGVCIVRDSYFRDYAQEMFNETKDTSVDDTAWPYYCIDWEKAAEELQDDYTAVTFDGIQYWIMSI